MGALNQILNCFAAIWLCTSFTNASPTVEIKNGTLEGTVMKTRKGKEFFAFRGVPYALPPLGELRFQPPQPAASWTGVRPAKEDAPICTQRDILTHKNDISGSEDCLYLNVYSPKLKNSADDNSQKSLPVMIFYHGGGWMTWSGRSDFYGPKFLLDQDVVLVTTNYRLGALGFLSTEDMISPGNMGMKDQSQVLRWVHENIAAFGGDPNSVTLFGESAGAASSHYHMISPLSKGLVHRGISQSGNVLCPWALTRPKLARKNAQRLAKYLGCPTESSKDLVDCLRKKNADEIIEAEKIFQVFLYDPIIPFRLVIEPDHPGAFLVEEPAQSLKTGNIADIPWMVGYNSHEGGVRSAALFGLENKKYLKMLDKKWNELAAITLTYEHTCPKESHEEVAQKLRKFYFGDQAIDESTKWQLIDVYSDSWFSIGTDMAIRDHLEMLSSPVFFYYFAYKSQNSFTKVFGDSKGDHGVTHCDELQYLFPVGDLLFPNSALSEQDHKMIDTLTTLWYNFAKTGNPTPKITSTVPAKWKPVRTEELEYLLIESPQSLKMLKNLNKERIDFWNTLPHRGNVIISNGKLAARDEL